MTTRFDSSTEAAAKCKEKKSDSLPREGTSITKVKRSKRIVLPIKAVLEVYCFVTVIFP